MSMNSVFQPNIYLIKSTIDQAFLSVLNIHPEKRKKDLKRNGTYA